MNRRRFISQWKYVVGSFLFNTESTELFTHCCDRCWEHLYILRNFWVRHLLLFIFYLCYEIDSKKLPSRKKRDFFNIKFIKTFVYLRIVFLWGKSGNNRKKTTAGIKQTNLFVYRYIFSWFRMMFLWPLSPGRGPPCPCRCRRRPILATRSAAASAARSKKRRQRRHRPMRASTKRTRRNKWETKLTV